MPEGGGAEVLWLTSFVVEAAVDDNEGQLSALVVPMLCGTGTGDVTGGAASGAGGDMGGAVALGAGAAAGSTTGPKKRDFRVVGMLTSLKRFLHFGTISMLPSL